MADSVTVKFEYNAGHKFWEYVAIEDGAHSYSVGHKSLPDAVKSAKKWVKAHGHKWDAVDPVWL